MRTIIALPAEAIEALDRLRVERGVSRASLVREAVAEYLAARSSRGRRSAFGAWGGGEDGLEIQRRLREEWTDP